MLNLRVGADVNVYEEAAAYRAAWDGGRDSRGRNLKSVWPEFAQLADIGIDPFRLIELFLETWPGVQIPDPRMALSEPYRQRYFRSPSAEEALRASLRTQSDYANTTFSALTRNPAYQTHVQIYRELVADRKSPLTLLFRYCLAARTGITDLQNKLFAAAVSEYMLKRDLYDRLWGDKLPAVLKDATMAQLLAYRINGRRT